MATKTISIMEDVYRLLLLNKIGNESFSEVLRRKLKKSKKEDIMQFSGILSKEEGDKILKDIKEVRKSKSRRFK